METTELKKCTCCGKEKPPIEFARNAHGHLTICRDCQSKKYIQGHKESRLKKELERVKGMRLKDFSTKEMFRELMLRGFVGKLYREKEDKYYYIEKDY